MVRQQGRLREIGVHEDRVIDNGIQSDFSFLKQALTVRRQLHLQASFFLTARATYLSFSRHKGRADLSS